MKAIFLIIASALLLGSFTFVSAQVPVTCSMTSTGSELEICYPASGSGSIGVLFPRNAKDFVEFISVVKAQPASERLDYMLETVRRIDRVTANAPILPQLLKDFSKSKNALKKFILQQVRIARSKQSPIMGETFDTSSTFRTLNIQQRPLSCEIAATSSIISSVLGQDITEDMLEKTLPKNFYAVGKDSIGLWGDPDLGFVGDIYGGQKKMIGFGVYEKPISALYANYEIESRIINKDHYTELGLTPESHLTELLTELRKGNRVQLWGDWCTNPAAEDGVVSEVTQQEAFSWGISATNACSSWNKDRTLEWYSVGPNLEKIAVKALNGEHALVLLGYVGSIDHPTHVIVWDVNTGKHTYPTSEWMRKWEKLSYKSIIVTAKK